MRLCSSRISSFLSDSKETLSYLSLNMKSQKLLTPIIATLFDYAQSNLNVREFRAKGPSSIAIKAGNDQPGSKRFTLSTHRPTSLPLQTKEKVDFLYMLIKSIQGFGLGGESLGSIRGIEGGDADYINIVTEIEASRLSLKKGRRARSRFLQSDLEFFN